MSRWLEFLYTFILLISLELLLGIILDIDRYIILCVIILYILLNEFFRLVGLLIIRLSTPLNNVLTVILILAYLLNYLLMVLMDSTVWAVSFQTDLLPTRIWIELWLLLLLLFYRTLIWELFKNPIFLGQRPCFKYIRALRFLLGNLNWISLFEYSLTALIFSESTLRPFLKLTVINMILNESRGWLLIAGIHVLFIIRIILFSHDWGFLT